MMKKRIIGSFVLVLVVAVAVGATTSMPSTTPKRPAVPISARGVGALGRLEPCSEVRKIHSPSMMEVPVIAELRVRVGQIVAAGEVLAVLDSHDRERADLDQSKAALLSAEKSLAQVLEGAKAGDIAAQRASVDQTRSKLELAEKLLSRARKLGAHTAIPEEEMDTRESNVEVLRSQLRQHESTLAAMCEVRRVDVERAEAEVVRSRAALQRAEADFAITEIRSPIHGEILRIHNREGERIGPDGLLELGDTRSMHVVAEIHESDILRVRLHQKASVFLRNVGKSFEGTVVEIGRLVGRKDVLSNDPVDDTDARVVEVRICLNEADSRVASGLSYSKVEVTIHTECELDSASNKTSPEQLTQPTGTATQLEDRDVRR